MTDPMPKPDNVEDTDRGETNPLPDPDGEAAREGGTDTEGLEGLGNLT